MNNQSQPEVNFEWYENAARKVIEQDKIDDVINKPIASGFNRIDDLAGGGFKKGELIILSAPTKNGKSTLAQTITWNMAKAKQSANSLWFTMEMSWQELTRKFMMMDETYRKDGHPSTTPICYPMDNYLKAGELQLQWMKDTIIEAKKFGSVEFVVIDHLHFLLPLKDFNTNTSFLIGGIVREIKKIAVELEIPIMLIAHTKKLELDKTPDLNSIRDSSFIAQEADFVFMMWRIRNKEVLKKTHSDSEDEEQEVYTRKAWLSLEANRRNGNTGRTKLWHDGVKFVSYDKETHGREEETADMVKSINKVKQINAAI